MYKRSKLKGNQASVQKLQRPRPEWSTDFTDNNKYKLSQAQMIQKKASLQSKNRQGARHDLQERRKKLEMGIIDQDTRKVYETALLSKNIDINPPIRKNLSQMIQYEKQIKASQKNQNCQDDNKGQEGDDFEQQIKNTQAFIKKMQKANKQGQIHKAVQILENATPRSPKRKNFEHFLSSKQLSTVSRRDYNDHSGLDSEVNLEETIKFMQETLFRKSKNKAAIKNNFMQQKKVQVQLRQQEYQEDQFGKATKFRFDPKQQIIQRKDEFKVSHLQIPIKERQDDIVDVDCMDTIRRMREMIESKEHLYDFGDSEPMQKQNNPFIVPNYEMNGGIEASILSKGEDSNAQIDFSLTMNQQNLQSRVKDAGFFMKGTKNFEDPQYQQFQGIKKTLFEQVNKMKSMSMQNPDNFTVSSIHAEPKKKRTKDSAKKEKKPNVQLQKIKDMINGTKNSVDSLKVETLKLPKTSDMGFDFRGSINIKKNLVQ